MTQMIYEKYLRKLSSKVNDFLDEKDKSRQSGPDTQNQKYSVQVI